MICNYKITSYILSISNPYKTILWNIETEMQLHWGFGPIAISASPANMTDWLWQINTHQAVWSCELSFNEIEGWVPFFITKTEWIVALLNPWKFCKSGDLVISNSWLCAAIFLPKILSLGVKKYEGQTDKINNPCFHKIFVSIIRLYNGTSIIEEFMNNSKICLPTIKELLWSSTTFQNLFEFYYAYEFSR